MEQMNLRSRMSKGPLSTLAKGLVVLELLATDGSELGISQISHQLSLPKSTVHRIVSTLVAHGYVRQNEDNGHYRLALKCWELGCTAVAQLDLVDVARSYLDDLAGSSGENVRLSSFDDGEIVYIYTADGSQVLRPYSRLGQRGPAHGTATGIVLIAHQPVEYLNRLVARGLAPFADGRIMTAEELLCDLEQVRRSDVAVVRGRWHPDVAAVAAPIRDHTGRVIAAGGVSGALMRFNDEAVNRFSQMTLQTMTAISEALGYRKESSRIKGGRC